MSSKICLSLVLLAAGAGLALLPAAEPRPANSVTLTVKGGYVEFHVDDELVTRYHTAESVAKPYFWPLNATGGIPVTRAWPMEKGKPGETTDHIHQKSAWFCHGDVIPEGIELKDKVRGVEGVDFWSETKGHGRIVCTRVGEPKTGPLFATIETANEWQTADGRKILDETRTISLHPLDDGSRLLVLDIDLSASVCPITFGDTKEGSLGVRVNDVIAEAKGKGKLENAEGKKGEKALWGHVSKWCDYSGPIDGKTAGIAIFDDPHNPHPAAWHSRGYGLMAANPFGRQKSGFPSQRGKADLVKLAKGDHLKLRYGLLVHRGDTQEGKVAQHYQQFVRLGPANRSR